jgi:hypothetical protein
MFYALLGRLVWMIGRRLLRKRLGRVRRPLILGAVAVPVAGVVARQLLRSRSTS